nr:RNA polymerase sigma-H factor-like [Nerophis lumbriciformis]
MACDAATGDLRAFEILVRRHEKQVLANCRFLTRSPNNAEDLSQEIFVKVFFHLTGFEGRAKFRTWLQRIKVNHCLNHLAKQRRQTTISLDEEFQPNTPELYTRATADRDLEAGRARQRIQRVLDQLSDNLRLPLVMRDVDGMAYQEIAEILGIGLSAVKMRIKRAREEFRQRYGAGPLRTAE